MIGLMKSLQFFPHILTMKTRSTLIFFSHNVKQSLPEMVSSSSQDLIRFPSFY